MNAKWILQGFLGVSIIQLTLARPAASQAWVPSRGEGNLTLTYQNIFTGSHLDEYGKRYAFGHVHSSIMVQEIEYGVTDNTALNISIPYVASKYTGTFPHLPTDRPTIDNGDYHLTFQDFHFGLRHNLCMRPVVLTPFVQVVIPSHHYEYFARSAAGFDLKEFQVGMNAGRRLDPFLARAFFQTQYSFGVTERTIRIRPFRERLNTQLGYFVTRHLSLNVFENFLLTHHGMFPSGGPNVPWWPYHDKIVDVSFLNLGFGGDLAVTKSVDIFASVATTVWGRDGDAIHDAIAFGINWNFRTSRFWPHTFARTNTKN